MKNIGILEKAANAFNMKPIEVEETSRNPKNDIMADPDLYGAIAISEEAYQELSDINKRNDLSREEKSHLNGEVIRPFLEK